MMGKRSETDVLLGLGNLYRLRLLIDERVSAVELQRKMGHVR
jgi:hypothetical protein